MARLTGRAFVLATLAGVAVLLFSGTASAESCKTECKNASDAARPNVLGSSLDAVNGLVQQPVRQLLGHGHRAPETTAPQASALAPAKTAAPAASPEDASPGLAHQATDAVSTATTPTASTPSLDIAEPVVSTVSDTVEAVVPVAETVATPARDLLEGQALQGVDTTTDAVADLGVAAVPVVAATVQTLGATTQQLLDTAHVTTTAVLGSAQQLVGTATSTLQPVTDSVTTVLATALGGPVPAPAGSASSVTHAEPGSGVNHPGGATLGDALAVIAIALPDPWSYLVGGPASADGQVPTPPPEQASDEIAAAVGDQSALVLAGQPAPVPAASGASGANGGGTPSPSATDLGKLFLDLAPAAPQPGFVPARHHSAHVPSAPVVEPAQSPD